ncbi:MAG: hypothetical protein GKR95_17235 [Gammaproteobacteria bacterium]|nr:hypothetical protein [Gammaproteobacteria bacterium]
MKEETVSRLYEELDEWNFLGEEAIFWWRDDDAQSYTLELQKLLDLSNKFSVPVSLAVIPQGLDVSLGADIDPYPLVTVLQHGFSHQNYAEPDQKKQELGSHRGAVAVLDELCRGMSILNDEFGEAFCAILVPPWNRIEHSLVSSLPEIGYKGISTFKPRKSMEAEQDLWAVNTHADIINWKSGRAFIGESSVIEQLTAHLKGKRLGVYDAAEPTGLLTHHLVHDGEAWNFLSGLLTVMDEHPAVKWVDAKTAFQVRWR